MEPATSCCSARKSALPIWRAAGARSRGDDVPDCLKIADDFRAKSADNGRDIRTRLAGHFP
jgi:hypothetical protein